MCYIVLSDEHHNRRYCRVRQPTRCEDQISHQRDEHDRVSRCPRNVYVKRTATAPALLSPVTGTSGLLARAWLLQWHVRDTSMRERVCLRFTAAGSRLSSS